MFKLPYSQHIFFLTKKSETLVPFLRKALTSYQKKVLHYLELHESQQFLQLLEKIYMLV